MKLSKFKYLKKGNIFKYVGGTQYYFVDNIVGKEVKYTTIDGKNSYSHPKDDKKIIKRV